MAPTYGSKATRAVKSAKRKEKKILKEIETVTEFMKIAPHVAPSLIGHSHSDTASSLRSPPRTPAEFAQAQRDIANKYIRAKSSTARDISPLPIEQIDWDRRNACKFNLKLFCETYLPNVFYKGWSHDQLRCIAKAETVFTEGGMFSLAMPRGGGKTALCRGGIIWASAFGHKHFMYFVGSTQPKAQQTLEFVKMYWYRSNLLQQDFPEIGYPIAKLENRYHLASGQMYHGYSTHVVWGGDSVRFPSLLLPKEIADVYLSHDPESLTHIEYEDRWMPKQAGLLIATAGVDGSIRGEADIHPITLEQPRPDLVLLDDVQKDSKADSPTSCEKLVRLIDGAISGLSGPGEHIAALMPCTVIREGDVSDTFLDPLLKPDWNPERCKLVRSWPDGVTDFEIRQDTDAGRLWNKYSEIRRKSLLQHSDISLATAFYGDPKNRRVMDEGFVVSWKERYTTKGKNPELSAQQHAMELRLISPKTFSAEYQNIGRKLIDEGEMLITASQLMQKTTELRWMQLQPDAEILCAFIDVQNEGFFWQVFSCNHDFTGTFPAWGLWPSVDTTYYTKAELDSWSLLTNAFFKKYPQYRKDATKTTRGHIRAPFEAKIYFGLEEVVKHVLSLEFERQDTHKKRMKISKLGIDTRYGNASDVIKRFIRETGMTNTIVPYNGQAFPPTNRQLEEYELRDGWLFEHQQHVNVKEPSWVIRPHASSGGFYLQADVSRLKDFLFRRLASPKGTPGSISLPSLPAENLELLCNHICSSEYPEPVMARGMIKNIWTVREGSAWDNDFLDCSAGNMALASLLGASLKTAEEMPRPAKRRLSDMYKDKKANRRPR